MAFSGAWRNRAMMRSDEGGNVSSADPARHMNEWDTGSHGIDDTSVTRAYPQTPYGMDSPSDSFMSDDGEPGTAPERPQYPQDMEPRDHGLSEASWSDNNVARDSVRPTTAHEISRGSAQGRRLRTPRMLATDESYTTPRFTPNTNKSGSEVQLKRGPYGYPEDNPPDTVQSTPGDDPSRASHPRRGWQGAPRDGMRVQRWETRKIPHMGHWKHGVRGILIRIAKTAGTTEPGVNQYESPFAALVNTRLGNTLSPMLRREPRAWDEDAVTDGSSDTSMADAQAQYSSWGL